MEGTERQIKFATDILNYVVYQIENSDADDSKKARVIECLKKQKKAEFIIDNFSSDFKLKDVRSRALDFFEYNDLSKVTQKELKSFKCTAITINEKVKDLDFITEKLPPKQPELTKETSIDKDIKKLNKVMEKEVEKPFKISKMVPSGVKYFAAKYDGYDCETGERIVAGELIWKDSQGIHRADNY